MGYWEILALEESTSQASPNLRDAAVLAIAIAVGVGFGVLLVRSLSATISDAARLPAPSALIVALSLLTLVAIIGALLTGDESAWTVGATGIGAMAGSLTAVYQRGVYEKYEEEEGPPTEEETLPDQRLSDEGS
jgi:hypothetical protein